MGKALSVLGKRAIKPVREFNLESRTFREITKEKPKVAPRHSSTVDLIDKAVRAQPEEVKKTLGERDDDLMKRLKEVYVTSEDVKPVEEIEEDPSRPLPTDRTYAPDPEYGYFEPKVIPYGKITLKDALHVIGKHSQDPQEWTAKRIAYEYKLNTGLTEKMLQNFHTFVLVVPADSKAKRKVTVEMLKADPMIAPHSVKQLPFIIDSDTLKKADS